MSTGAEFWVVAMGCSKDQGGKYEKETYMKELKKVPALCGALPSGSADKTIKPVEGVLDFDVPDGERSLMFGSFDNLIKLTDDLQKNDGQVDTIVHRLERQYLEIEPNAELKVKSQRKEQAFPDYLRTWTWDEAKYPKTRTIADNLALLMTVVNKLDEEARNKTGLYNELKTQKGNLATKDNLNLPARDLIDVLTPKIVKNQGQPSDDFISTEHLTTICVILARGSDQEFLKSYETGCARVVPRSARHFKNLDDKDGNQLWRIVVFKDGVEPFLKYCRDKRYTARQFEYSEEAYKKLQVQREKVNEDLLKQHELVKGLYKAAWSDVMVAWIHIKAMRVFVESVLRFGMPPRFASFIVTPKSNQIPQARKALAEILSKSNKMGKAEPDDDDEEYFPYVSFSCVPFVVPR